MQRKKHDESENKGKWIVGFKSSKSDYSSNEVEFEDDDEMRIFTKRIRRLIMKNEEGKTAAAVRRENVIERNVILHSPHPPQRENVTEMS
ncbi:hypothetical protein ACLOJK_027511 [Asimina triloba]